MSKKIVISEKDNIAALIENNKVNEFFVSKGDVLMGDVYLARVDNVLPSIEAAFLDVGMPDKMAFIHANDISGKGPLKEKVKPNQKLIVQVVKEPTGHKGPRVTTALSLPGRFLVLLPDETGVNVSRKIVSNKERARLKSIVSLLKPVGVGVIVRTEAEGQSEAEIQEDIEILLEKWNSIVTAADTANPPCLLYRDQDLLYRVIREACTEDVEEIIVDTPFALHRTTQLLQHWNMNVKVNMPSGGYLFIQQTEALTVIDVNSGKFTSSSTQDETILKTNIEAVHEIARQLRLRNIGGMIIIDFIDMLSRADKLAIMEEMELALEPDKAKPQVGQLSDLGLVELTRHRQGQSLSEIFTKKCPHCQGSGYFMNEFNFATPTAEAEMKAKVAKAKMPIATFTKKSNNNKNNNQQQNRQQEAPAVENVEIVETTVAVEEVANVEENNFDRKGKKNRRNKFNKRNKNNRFPAENTAETETAVEAPVAEQVEEQIVPETVVVPEAVVEEPKKKSTKRTRKSSKTKEEPVVEAVVPEVEAPAVENVEPQAVVAEEKPKRRPNRGSSRAARKTKAKKTEDET